MDLIVDGNVIYVVSSWIVYINLSNSNEIIVFSLYLSLSLSLPRSLFLSYSLSLSFDLSFSPSLSPSLSLSSSLSLSLLLYIFFFFRLSFFLSGCCYCLSTPWTWTIADPRVEDWLFMSSPLQTLSICLSYVMIVKVWGPYFMKDRPAFQFRRLLIVYNFVQVVFSTWLFYEVTFKCFTFSSLPFSTSTSSAPTPSSRPTSASSSYSFPIYCATVSTLAHNLFTRYC